MTKKKFIIPKKQTGGPILTAANQARPLDVPLSVKLQQQQQQLSAKYRRKSGSSSSKSSNTGMDFSDFDKLDEANVSDKTLAFQEMQNLQNEINGYYTKYGERASVMPKVQKLTNALAMAKANSANGLKQSYDYVNTAETSMLDNQAGDAFVMPDIGTMLVQDQSNGEYKKVSVTDYYNNKDGNYRPVKNQEWIEARRLDPRVASIDVQTNGQFTSWVSQIKSGDKLREGIQTVLDTAGTEEILKKYDGDFKQLTKALNDPEKAYHILTNGHSSKEYMETGDYKNMMNIVGAIMDPKTSQFFDPSLKKGLYQAAYKSVLQTGIPEDIENLDQAIYDRMGTMLISYATGMSTQKFKPYESDIDVAKAAAEGIEDAKDTKLNYTGQAFWRYGHPVEISVGGFETLATQQKFAPKDHKVLYYNNDLMNLIPDKTKIKLAKGEALEDDGTDYLSKVVPTTVAFLIAPVEDDGTVFTGYIEGSSRKKYAENTDLMYNVSFVSKRFQELLGEAKNPSDEMVQKALDKAVNEFYTKTHSDKGLLKDLGFDKGISLEKLKKELQTEFNLKPVMYIEGFTSKRGYSDGEGRVDGKNIYNNAVANSFNRGTESLPTTTKAFKTSAYIPITDNATMVLDGNRSISELDANDVSSDAGLSANILTGQKSYLDGGKLITFNDL